MEASICRKYYLEATACRKYKVQSCYGLSLRSKSALPGAQSRRRPSAVGLLNFIGMLVNYGSLRTHPSSFDWRQRLYDPVFSLEHLDPIWRQCVGPVHCIHPSGRYADGVAAPFDPHIALL